MKKRVLTLALVALMLVCLSLTLLCSCGGDDGPKITVTFNLNGGVSSDDSGDGTFTREVSEGGLLTEPTAPTKEGYNFRGWFFRSTQWDFAEDAVTREITLDAWWVSAGGAGSSGACEHQYNYEAPVEYVAATCFNAGRQIVECSLCGHRKQETLVKRTHDMQEVVLEANCGNDGWKKNICQHENCTFEIPIETYPASGEHDYQNPVTTIQATKYTGGQLTQTCTVCGAKQVTPISALCLIRPAQLNQLQIDNFTYSGGEYDNEPFVDIGSYAKGEASSFYSVCYAGKAVDGDVSTYWCAETMADGATMTGDSLVIELQEPRVIGAINLVVPFYSAWGLGDECYVSFDIEAYIDEEWVMLGEMSDKTAESAGVNGTVMMVLDEPITTNKLRATVTHATRYTPAKIYEFKILADTAQIERVPTSMEGECSVAVSGKYNDYAEGGAALIDGDLSTAWFTNARYTTAYAEIEFTGEKFVASVQVATLYNEGRKMKLYCWIESSSGGNWVEISELVVPSSSTPSTAECQKIIINEGTEDQFSICMFTQTLEMRTKKLKLEIATEPVYWDSKIYSFTPFTVVEQAKNEVSYIGCRHYTYVSGETVLPTCTTPGYTMNTCACGQYTAVSDMTDALGHTWGEYEVTTLAAGTTTGVQTATCTVDGCNATKTRNYGESYQPAIITPYYKNAPAAWSMTLDDGHYLDTYEWAMPVFEYYRNRVGYGYKATAVLTISFMELYVDEWHEYLQSGAFDIGHHSYTHTGSYGGKISESSLVHEVNDATYWFMSKFPGQRIICHAAPNGATSDDAAWFITGSLAANRVGDCSVFYNLIENLVSGKQWGALNDYVSKADQTEGIYLYVGEGTSGTYVKVVDAEATYDEEGKELTPEVSHWEWSTTGSYQNANTNEGSFRNDNSGRYVVRLTPSGEYKFVLIKELESNYVFSEEDNRIVNQNSPGTFIYVPANYATGTTYYESSEGVFEWTTGSYDKASSSYTYREDNEGNYILVRVQDGYKFIQKSLFENDFVYNSSNELVNNKDLEDKITGTYFYNTSRGTYEWKTSGCYSYNAWEGTMDWNEGASIDASNPYIYTIRCIEGPSRSTGTYRYEFNELFNCYVYNWYDVGSYDYNAETGEYTWRNDSQGKIKLWHTELGSYERGITTLLDNGAWTVECLHCFGYNAQAIWSSYTSTISKLEYLSKAGVWTGSYTEVTQYIKEYQTAIVDTTEYTESRITLTLTDGMDDIMFNFPLTIKVDIPDSWTNITATQAGNELEFFIEGGFAYVDAVPDCGDIVLTPAQ